MSWYYASGGQQQGPIDDAQFETMIQSGQIKPADLVWKEGMANWQPLSTVRSDVMATVSTPVAAAAAAGFLGGLSPDEITCAECGGRFTRDNAIQYGSTWVCASCKPRFVQKLKEGAALGVAGGMATMNYAGFWIRFAAKFIDNLITTAIVAIPMLIIGVVLAKSAAQGQGGPSPALAVFLQLGMFGIQLGSVLIVVAYNTFFNGKYGATPGKMAVGLKIVTSDGEPIPMLRAFGRAWAEQLSGCTLLIGYIIAAFDPEKRALHDHMCNTRVVYK